MIFSCRIMKKHVLIKYEMNFMSFRWKCMNAIRSGWVGLMEFRCVKIFEVEKIMLWVEKKVKMDENFDFSYFKNFPHLKNLKIWSYILFPHKNSSKLSLLGFSYFVQMLNGSNEAHRFKIKGLYTLMYEKGNSRVPR